MTLILGFLCGASLLIDGFMRHRSATISGVQGPSDWRGFLSYPVIGVIGVVSTLVVGWLGIVLGVVAAFVASETFNISSPSGEKAGRFTVVRQHVTTLQMASLFVLEILIAALCVRSLLGLLSGFVSGEGLPEL